MKIIVRIALRITEETFFEVKKLIRDFKTDVYIPEREKFYREVLQYLENREEIFEAMEWVLSDNVLPLVENYGLLLNECVDFIITIGNVQQLRRLKEILKNIKWYDMIVLDVD